MLQKLRFDPGFNKQVTATGGEGQWVSGDYVRFRYQSPEKIGGSCFSSQARFSFIALLSRS